MKSKAPSHKLTIAILCAVLLMEISYYAIKNDVIPVFSVNKTTQAEIKDEFIVALFMEDIREKVNEYYNEYFSEELAVYNYEVEILKVKKEVGPPRIYISFGITPMIGAHNPVGYDEAVFMTDVFGKVTFISYEHIKSFDFPDRLKNKMIKPYPPEG